MHFTSALVAFVSLAAAGPLALPQGNAGTGSGDANTCDAATFTPVVGRGNPPVLDDCYKVRDAAKAKAAKANAPFKVDESKEIARVGSCAFYAAPQNPGDVGYIGVNDINDLIDDAIKEWQKVGGTEKYQGMQGVKRVGTGGTVPCSNRKGGYVTIVWTIGHT